MPQIWAKCRSGQLSGMGQQRRFDRGRLRPVFMPKRTSSWPVGMSQKCRFCCRSRLLAI